MSTARSPSDLQALRQEDPWAFEALFHASCASGASDTGMRDAPLAMALLRAVQGDLGAFGIGKQEPLDAANSFRIEPSQTSERHLKRAFWSGALSLDDARLTSAAVVNLYGDRDGDVEHWLVAALSDRPPWRLALLEEHAATGRRIFVKTESAHRLFNAIAGFMRTPESLALETADGVRATIEALARLGVVGAYLVNGSRPVNVACIYGTETIARVFVEYFGAEHLARSWGACHENVWHELAYLGDYAQRTRWLIDRSREWGVDWRAGLNGVNVEGQTPLAIAVSCASRVGDAFLDNVRVLLDSGAYGPEHVAEVRARTDQSSVRALLQAQEARSAIERAHCGPAVKPL